MTEDVQDAARLVQAALTASHHRPDPQVVQLRDRYGDDMRFRATVDAVAAGLGLQVLGATDVNLVVAATSTSPLAMRLRDVGGLTDVDDRLRLGLALLGVVAYCYPTSGQVDDRRTLVVDPVEVARELTEVCEQLEADHPADTPVDSEQLREAWRMWLRLPPVELTEHDHLRVRGSRLWFVQRACDLLAEQRLLVADGDRFRTTPALRVHVNHAAYELHVNLLRAAFGHADAGRAEEADQTDAADTPVADTTGA